MYRKEVVVKNLHGLHARPASQFVQQAAKFKSEIYLEIQDKVVNVKSILSLLSAGIKYNTPVVIAAQGEDEEAAVETLVRFIEELVE